MSKLDLVIVGAGAAGIGAAKAARRLGLDYVVVEASHRIGGRAHTECPAEGIQFDLGCHWLHSASRNPLTLRHRKAMTATMNGHRLLTTGYHSTIQPIPIRSPSQTSLATRKPERIRTGRSKRVMAASLQSLVRMYQSGSIPRLPASITVVRNP